MPSHKYYLLVRSGVLVGEFYNLTAMAYHLGIDITDEGQIIFMGERRNPQYVMKSEINWQNSWEKPEAIADWARCYLSKNLSSDYKIHKCID